MLSGSRFETMEIHNDSLILFVHMNIGRGDMRLRQLFRVVMRHANTARLSSSDKFSEAFRCDRWPRYSKKGFFDTQTARHMNLPRACYLICIGQSDVLPLMIGEIKIVLTQRVADPIRHFYKRGALNIAANARIGIGANNRSVEETSYLNAVSQLIGSSTIRSDQRRRKRNCAQQKST